MGPRPVVALATALIASGRELPARPTRYLVLWCGGRWLAEALRRHGVMVEAYRYRTTVKGRKYERWKLVVRDERLTARLAKLSSDAAKLSALLRRFEGVVVDVLAAMKRMRGWMRLLDLIPRGTLMRWFGIRPFNYVVYKAWADHAIVRAIKPNWRGWLYRRLLAAKEKAGKLGYGGGGG